MVVDTRIHNGLFRSCLLPQRFFVWFGATRAERDDGKQTQPAMTCFRRRHKAPRGGKPSITQYCRTAGCAVLYAPLGFIGLRQEGNGTDSEVSPRNHDVIASSINSLAGG